ncbi:unnamed protein product, partial [Rotaria socialis]
MGTRSIRRVDNSSHGRFVA